MSLAIGSNPSSRRWKPIEEQPRITDERMRRIYQYYQQLRGDLPKKIKRSYFFIDGRQTYNEHFQRVFGECFAQMRGTSALVKDASNSLKYKFEHFPDVCIRIEVPLYYDEDTGSTPVNVIRNPNPELQEKLKSILDRTRGLQQELLGLLEQEGKKLHPELKADDLDCFPKDSIEGFRQTHPFSLYPLALVFSTVLPKCSDVFKDILIQLLQLAWLEEQLPAMGNPIDLPSKAASTLVEFPFRGMQYILSKTNDDGACALHALLGEPVDREYRYAGPDNVRELFAKRLEEKMRSSAVIRTKVTNIIYSHLDRPDASSELFFAGQSGQALRIVYCLSRAGVDQFVQEANQAEAGIWQLQIAKPHIREKLLAEAKLKRRYTGMTKDAILRKLEEYPELILSLVNESPDEFLRLLESPTYWKVLDVRSQRQKCLEWAGINRKLFAINQLYPHYLEVIKDPRYFFNTQELELAATIFDKKMQAIQFLNDRLEIATEMINEELPGDPIIIFHGGVHFSRCRPKERFDTAGPLYQEANAHAAKLVEWDEQSSKRLVSTLKDEASHLAISGLVSAGTRSPLPIYGQLLRTLTNVCGAKVDPFNQHKSTQAAKLLVNSAGSYALGGGITQVGKAFAIDAWATMTAPIDMSKSESAKRSFGVSLLKGLGGNDKEFLDSVIGGIVSGGLSLVTPEEQEGEGWVKRVLRAIPTNSDIHKTIQDLAVKSLEAPSKKAAGGALEDKLKDCKKWAQEIEDEVFDGPWLEEYSTWKAGEEKAAREKREAKIQARKKLAKDLREQLTGIKEQGLESEWLDKLAQEGRSSGGMEAKIDTAVDPLDVNFEQAEPPHVIRQEIQGVIKELIETKVVIQVGTELVRNTQDSVEIIDNGRYEVKKQSGNWRVYRDGQEVYKSKGKSNGDKEKCYLKIPTLKEQYGIKEPSQLAKDAINALSDAQNKESNLTQKLEHLTSRYQADVNNLHYSEIGMPTGQQELATLTNQVINEKIAEIDRSISQEKDVLRVRKEHLNNLRQDWRVYKDERGKFVPMEAGRQAEQAVDMSISEISNLEQLRHSYQKLVVDPGMRDAKKYHELLNQKDLKLAEKKTPEGAKRSTQIDAEIAALDKAILEASAPKETPPSPTIPVVVDVRKDKKNHHPFYVDDKGLKQDLGKYKTQEDTLFICSLFSNLLLEGKSCEVKCHDALTQASAQGIPIENLPNRPYFDMPTMVGNDASKNADIISAALRDFKNQTKAFVDQVSDIVKQQQLQPINPQGFSKGEIKELSKAIVPHIKDDPKDHGFGFKFWRALGKGYNEANDFLHRINFSTAGAPGGTVNLLTASSPELNRARGEPSLFHYDLKTKSSDSKSPYQETRHEIAVQRSEAETMESQAVEKPSPQTYNWTGVQQYQQQKMLDTNMAFKSPSQPPCIDYGSLQDTGLPLPPITTAQAIQSGTRAPETQSLAMKQYPEGNRTQSNIPTWLRYFASGGESLDPQERIDQNTQILVAHTKAAAKTFGQIADELRSFGCINAKFDHGKVTLKFDRSVSDKLDQFINQHLPDMSHVRNFHYLEFTAGLANDVMLQVFAMPFFRVVPRMTISRRIVSIEERAATRMAEQMAFLERMNSPAYRSGFVSESTVAKLTERQIRVITPVKLPPVQVGEELTWVSHNLPKVRQIQQVRGMDKFDQYLRRVFRDQTLTEMQVRRVLNYSGFHTYPKPLGLPSNIVVEISKSNGGMIYRLTGTKNNQNLVVRVCPGLAKESIVSSVLKGKHLNGEMHGTLRQQYPYVVQRNGKLTLTKNGEWIDLKDPCNKGKEALTHIRLEEYQFKGWE